jgi:hypothetical protein
MPAPNDRLIRVVSVQVKTTPAENPGENVSRRGNTLPGGASNGDREGSIHDTLSIGELCR